MPVRLDSRWDEQRGGTTKGMMNSSYDRLFEAADAGAVLVVDSVRLARRLRLEHGSWCRNRRGKKLWATPDITTWNAWLRRCWMQATRELGPELPTLLSDTEARMLWMEAMQAVETPGRIEREWDLATKAYEARTRLIEYGREIAADRHYGADAEWFSNTHQLYQARLESLHVVDRAALPKALLELARDGRWKPAVGSVYHGMEYTAVPVVAQLVAAWEGVWSSASEPQERGGIVAQEASSVTEEWKLAARWAAEHLQAAAERGKAAPRLGIVWVNLPEVARTAERALQDALDTPAVFFPRHAASQASTYDVDCPRPLDAWGPVRVALTILAQRDDRISEADLALLLTSPWVLTPGEAAARERAHAALRGERAPYHRTEQVEQALREHGARESAGQFREWRALWSPEPGFLDLRQWVARWRSALGAWNWPAVETHVPRWFGSLLDSWNLLLDSAARTCRTTVRTFDHHEAVRWLRACCRDWEFQAYQAEAPVQVLDLADAAGYAFDAVWIGGLTDDAFPYQPDAPAFLPREVMAPSDDVDTHMAGATAASRIKASAAALLAALASSEGEVTLSWSQWDRLGHSRVRLSTLATRLAGGRLEHRRQAEAVVPRAVATSLEGASQDVTVASLDPGFRVEVGESQGLRGGAYLLRAQAHCPFQATAVYRLGAAEWMDPAAGPDQRLRGVTVHAALDMFWRELGKRCGKELGTQDDLRALGDKELQKLIYSCAWHAVKRDSQARRLLANFPAAMGDLEVAQVETLLHRWMDAERGRHAAFEVMAVEKPAIIELKTRAGTLELKVKIDRIDRVDNGLVLIDYKTGAQVDTNTKAAWLDDPPEEPQLLLYALSIPSDPLHGLAFGIVNVKRCDLLGLGTVGSGLTSVDGWGYLSSQFRDRVRELATAFLEGRSNLRPIRANTCARCPARPVCRIDDLRMMPVILEEAEEGGEHAS